MMDSGKIKKEMEKVDIFSMMEAYMKETGLMIKCTEKVD